MKKHLLFAFIIPLVIKAQIPVGYYNTAQGLTGQPLFSALHYIIDNHTQVSYAGLWNSYPKTDRKPDGKVWDIYTDIPLATPVYTFAFITDQCGNYAVEGDCYNREHSWPQSWFNSLSGPVSDMFHIYPTDGKVNGVRSNYPYGNVSAPTYTSSNGGKLGGCTNLGYTQTVFEPIDEYKGDLARGYFYMSTRYFTEDGGWSSSTATNKSVILPWQINVLLQWHHQDPVSAKEIARNDTIYKRYQHNRNPFIDNPQWADSIWTEDITVFVAEHELANTVSLYPNPATNEFYLINQSQLNTQQLQVQITNIAGQVIENKELEFNKSLIIDCSVWEQGIYFIKIKNDNAISNLRFIKQ